MLDSYDRDNPLYRFRPGALRWLSLKDGACHALYL